MERGEAVLTGMMLSFIVYATAVIWVFAASSALRAWAGLLVVSAPLLLVDMGIWRAAGA